ncbi:WGR domain-containing protein [Falsirhodobacter deserti]|uniref:WGR domain-containing protein n=1 Tax=Falsirhodobacter deserti TaxID=1365611 RepID=UPI000FE36E45|nr:WGR domain-containing protein [Falsirhodobacter deserti]
MDVYLEKIDARHNCCRFYSLRIEKDLFAEHLLVAQWGRIGGRGRSMIKGSGPLASCQQLRDRIVAIRERRGYVQPA